MLSNLVKLAAVVLFLAMGAAAYAVKTNLIPLRAWIDMVRAPVEQVDSDEIGTVLVTGSNSGIGLEFAKQYAAKGWTVIATHRRDSTPESLQMLSSQFENVMVERLDLLDHDGIDALAAKLSGIPIDLLINNAGIVVSGDGAGQSFGTLDYADFDLFIHTNALGPVKVVEAFLPNVAASNAKKIVNISSVAGAVSLPSGSAGSMWYRASKAALNSLMVALTPAARDSGVIVAMFDPGWVRTQQPELSRGMIEAEESVAALIPLIAGLKPEDSGRFLTRRGYSHPW